MAVTYTHLTPVTCTVAIIDMSTAAIIDVTTIAASSSSSRRCLCSPGALRLLHDPQSWLHMAPAARTWLQPPHVAPVLLLPVAPTCGAFRSSDRRLTPLSVRASFFMCHLLWCLCSALCTSTQLHLALATLRLLLRVWSSSP